MKYGTRVILQNLEYLYQDDDDASEYAHLIGKTGAFVGDIDERTVYNDNYDTDDQEYDEAFYVEFDNVEDDKVSSIYVFKWNVKILPRELPKNELEWLDRIQQNFQED